MSSFYLILGIAAMTFVAYNKNTDMKIVHDPASKAVIQKDKEGLYGHTNNKRGLHYAVKGSNIRPTIPVSYPGYRDLATESIMNLANGSSDTRYEYNLIDQADNGPVLSYVNHLVF